MPYTKAFIIDFRQDPFCKDMVQRAFAIALGSTLCLLTNLKFIIIMIEPVALKDFFITFFSSALIIMAGASYALLFAWSKVKPQLGIKISAYACYVILLLSVYQLTLAANLDGYWRIISYLMVIGYFFAPIGIWHLCKVTHDEPDSITTVEKENE